MKVQPTCPDAKSLVGMLDCALPEAQQNQVAQHVDSCETCQQRLETLVTHGLPADLDFENVGTHLRNAAKEELLLSRDAMQRLTANLIDDTAAFQVKPEHFSLDFLEPSEEPESIGRLGQYEINEVLGRGGMGIALKGRDTRLNRVVAVKVLAPELAANPTARKRFLREARAAAAVSHDHVVTTFAVEPGDLPYLAMEYIDGQSLQQKIDREGALELREILRIGMQAAYGLSAAHAQGLVHRDIKPSNIMLQNSIERVQITDFGLARAVDDVTITRTGDVTGTPQYMSPEQIQGLPVDHRADLFALGCVLYAMCTGRSPFRGESTMAVLNSVCSDSPRPIAEVNPDIPDWLVAIIDLLLEKDADNRIQTAVEVADLLSQCLAHVQQPVVVPLPNVPPANDRVKSHVSHRPKWHVGAILLAIVLGSLGLTEATGVTRVSTSLVRIVTGEGTLVVEIDDPEVSVTIDGRDLVITGAGPREVRLKPGQYELRATRDGAPVKTELVTIDRGGRRVVRITREPVPSSTDTVVSATDYRSIPEGAITRVRQLAGHRAAISRIRVLGDGRRCLTRSQDGTVRLWEINTSKLLKTFRFSDYWSPSLAVALGQQVAATEYPKGTILVFDLETGESFKELSSGHSDVIWHLDFSPDGRRLLSRSRDETLRLWDVETGKELRQFDAGPWWSGAAAFSPDGDKLFYGNGGFLVLWDLKMESELWRAGYDDEASHISSLTVSADGQIVATSTYGGPIHLRHAATGKLLGTLVGQPKSSVVAFTPDGRHLISGNQVDKTLRVWSVENYREICRIDTVLAITNCVAVLPDGRHVISGGGNRHEPPDQWIPEGDYNLHVWRLPESVGSEE